MIHFPYQDRIIETIDPVVQHPVFRYAAFVVSEVIKIIAVKTFLELLGKHFLTNKNSHFPGSKIYASTIFAPLAEEILFRFILLRGVHLAQYAYHNYFGHQLTEEDRTIQQVFRVHLCAFIFASAHLLNPHETVESALIQFTWTYLGGTAYGYLSEKYHTLSLGIFFHGINNFLAVASGVYAVAHVPLFFVGILLNKRIVYTIAVGDIGKLLDSELQKTTQCYADPLRYFSLRLQQRAQFYADLPGHLYTGTARFCESFCEQLKSSADWDVNKFCADQI